MPSPTIGHVNGRLAAWNFRISRPVMQNTRQAPAKMSMNQFHAAPVLLLGLVGGRLGGPAQLRRAEAAEDEGVVQGDVGRRADEDKVRKIEAASAQLVHQRDAHKRDADEGRRIKSELDKAKARIKRMEEAAIKREAEHNEDKMKLQRTESLLMRAARGVVQAKDAITHTQHQMILEGLQAEKNIEVAGIHYYLYRRPCVVSQTFKPTGDEVVSRDHMYIYRVETSAGYHWDAVPLQNGDIGTVKHKAIPKDVKKYLFEQYRESALFDVGQAVLKGPELTEGMDSLTTVLAELESIDHSLTPLKVKDSLKQTKARKLLRGKAA